MDDIILYALPVFAVLIAVEFCWGLRAGRNSYALGDTVASLSQGLIGQCVALCTQLLQVGLYAIVWRHWALFDASPWNTTWGWVGAVVLFDFFDYWLHRVGHERWVFWAAHVVHHQSHHFNLSTALRQESTVPLLGWVFYLPMAFLGVPPVQFVVAGLVVLIYQFWIHTEHIGKLGWFDRVFSSPSNHRVHHAVNPQYINKNYGGMLVIWDRLFGTFAEEDEACVYGTQSDTVSVNPLRAIGQVYAVIAIDAWHTKRWVDKLRIWFMPTGWRPADVMASHPKPEFDLDAARNRRPVATSARTAVPVTLLFLAMLGATAWLLFSADELSTLQTLAVAVGICGGLWLASALLERGMESPLNMTGIAPPAVTRLQVAGADAESSRPEQIGHRAAVTQLGIEPP